MKYVPVYLILILGICGIWVANFYINKQIKEKQQNYSEEIATYINNDLTYEKSKWDSEYNKMNSWAENSYVSDSDRGILYERMANIYHYKEDIMGYYKYLGYALYYLEKAGNTNVAANIYTDLANYYVTNNSFPTISSQPLI